MNTQITNSRKLRRRPKNIQPKRIRPKNHVNRDNKLSSITAYLSLIISILIFVAYATLCMYEIGYFAYFGVSSEYIELNLFGGTAVYVIATIISIGFGVFVLLYKPRLPKVLITNNRSPLFQNIISALVNFKWVSNFY